MSLLCCWLCDHPVLVAVYPIGWRRTPDFCGAGWGTKRRNSWMTWFGKNGTYLKLCPHLPFFATSREVAECLFRLPICLAAWRKVAWVLTSLTSSEMNTHACVCFQLLILTIWNPESWTNLCSSFKDRKQVADYEAKSTSMPVFRLGIGLKRKYKHGSERSSILFLHKGEMPLIQTNTDLVITMVTKMCALYTHWDKAAGPQLFNSQ